MRSVLDVNDVKRTEPVIRVGSPVDAAERGGSRVPGHILPSIGQRTVCELREAPTGLQATHGPPSFSSTPRPWRFPFVAPLTLPLVRP